VICILNCCKVIFGFLRTSQSDQSADAFVPLLIYTVLQANPDHLVSNVQYILRFRNQDKLGGEAGYYISSLVHIRISPLFNLLSALKSYRWAPSNSLKIWTVPPSPFPTPNSKKTSKRLSPPLQNATPTAKILYPHPLPAVPTSHPTPPPQVPLPGSNHPPPHPRIAFPPLISISPRNLHSPTPKSPPATPSTPSAPPPVENPTPSLQKKKRKTPQ